MNGTRVGRRLRPALSRPRRRWDPQTTLPSDKEGVTRQGSLRAGNDAYARVRALAVELSSNASSSGLT
jgi:hypothetical protein